MSRGEEGSSAEDAEVIGMWVGFQNEAYFSCLGGELLSPFGVMG